MKTLLTNKSSRKHFLLIIGAVLLLSITIRYLVTPEPSNTSNTTDSSQQATAIIYLLTILDGIVTSALVTIAIGLFLKVKNQYYNMEIF
ncbi:hypothetical protein [Tenacibaculum xiamenense]|uniref:hypothetical protein n=1 Tax=Tenacibaculum xiamenense TaxID=1261553 RepID=UPI0038B5E2BA